jgi:hypothetical protein
MLCFLLINFIEDIEIDGILVDHFQKKSKLRLSFFISKFLNDHRPQRTHYTLKIHSIPSNDNTFRYRRRRLLSSEL